MKHYCSSPREKIRLKYFDLAHGTTTIDGLGIFPTDKEQFIPYFEDKHIRKIIDGPAKEEEALSIQGWEQVAKSICYYDLLATRHYFEYLSLYRSKDLKKRKDVNSSLLSFFYFTMEVVQNLFLLGLPIKYEHIPQNIESLRLISAFKNEVPSEILMIFQYMGAEMVKNIESMNLSSNLCLLPREKREVQEKLWDWCKDLHLTLKAYSVL